ncbi:alpha/beta hydrolase family esterase [Bacteroidota bacterium]
MNSITGSATHKIFSLAIIFFFIFLSSGCGGYITEGTVEEDYSERSYEYFIPSGNNPDNPSPLIFVFHGAQSSAWSMHYATHFDEYAEEHNCIVIYPNSVEGYWNLNNACSAAYDDNYNDLGYVDYLLAKFSSEYSVDHDRIYATGFSLGAMFTMTVALERPNIFAAIAPLAGAFHITSTSKFNNANKIPIMILQGTLDFDEGGGEGDCERYSTLETVEQWAAHNGCDQNPTVEDLPDTGEDYIHVIRETYNNCSNNKETIFYKVEGGIHEWFMFDEFNATETIMEFFLRHSR